MKKEQKIEWIKNANNEELLDQYMRSCEGAGRYPTFSEKWVEYKEDAKLCKIEILKRMK